jgi:hypothetical protein
MVLDLTSKANFFEKLFAFQEFFRVILRYIMYIGTSHQQGDQIRRIFGEKSFYKIPGSNPTMVSYNASAVKIYNASSSLVRFENKNIFFLH